MILGLAADAMYQRQKPKFTPKVTVVKISDDESRRILCDSCIARNMRKGWPAKVSIGMCRGLYLREETVFVEDE